MIPVPTATAATGQPAGLLAVNIPVRGEDSIAEEGAFSNAGSSCAPQEDGKVIPARESAAELLEQRPPQEFRAVAVGVDPHGQKSAPLLQKTTNSFEIESAATGESRISDPRRRAHNGSTLADIPEAQISYMEDPISMRLSKNRLSMQISRSKQGNIGCTARSREILEGWMVRLALTVCLLVALFGGNMVIILDLPDDPTIFYVDHIMLIITAIFSVEIIARSIIYGASYMNSFFFWMDIIGTVSMVFEISWLAGGAGQPRKEGSNMLNVTVLRVARTMKLATRLARLSKMLKAIVAWHMQRDGEAEDTGHLVEKISRQIRLALSTKVALLTVLLMLCGPLFDILVYPEADFSMRLWADRLELEFKREFVGNLTGHFHEAIFEMDDFYSNLNYLPFKISGFGVQDEFLNRPAPNRQENVLIQSAGKCLVDRRICSVGGPGRSMVLFDFTSVNWVSAWMDVLLVVFMIMVMLWFTTNLNETLDSIVLHPLQNMMEVVRGKTAMILQQVSVMESGDESLEWSAETEIDLLEGVLSKLTKLVTIFNQKAVVDNETLAALDAEDRGVLVDIMGMESPTKPYTPVKESLLVRHSKYSMNSLAENLPADQKTIDSWRLNMLQLDASTFTPLVLYMLDDPQDNRRFFRVYADEATILSFLGQVQSKYTDQRYHCYAHALEVLHTVHRFFNMVNSKKWVPEVDQYALLISAICHDVGHMGRTNQFLVETGHELALMYNDKSPLENLHCSTLFQICSNPKSNVFKKLPKDEHRAARKVCINAILHTDNAHHFDMVKEISRIYEMGSKQCDLQAAEPSKFSTTYLEEVLHEHERTFLNLFLHQADISSQMKPFEVAKMWGWRVLDEFFEQGDEEKQLQLPVGMLNDRDKICRPASQHGFIVFLVCPLAMAATRVFPMFRGITETMVSNLREYRNMWVQEMSPSAEDIAKKDADIQAKVGEVRVLVDREAMKDDTGGVNYAVGPQTFHVARARTFAVLAKSNSGVDLS